MRSTGEVMGIDSVFGTAYAKSQAGAYGSLPTKGRAFVSVANRDKRSMIFPAKELADLGFELLATAGTAEVLQPQRHQRHRRAQAVTRARARTASRPSSSSSTTARSTSSSTPRTAPAAGLDGYDIRTAAVARGVPCLTTVQALAAAVQGIEALNRGDVGVRSLQEHAEHLTAARD